jgi:hypothetical protein
VSTYRQIRRQTRRARRAGLQPIVVIDSPFPVPVALLLARYAWRYRSEIAPAVTAGAVLAAGGWLHHGHHSLWPWLLAASDLAALVLFKLGAHPGWPSASARLLLFSWLAGGSRPPRCSARSPRRCRNCCAPAP